MLFPFLVPSYEHIYSQKKKAVAIAWLNNEM